MNRVTGEWAQAHGDTVTLRLPAVHLLDKNFIDEARTKVFYESGNGRTAHAAICTTVLTGRCCVNA